MSRKYKISQLIMNNETPYYTYSDELRRCNKIKEVQDGDKTRYLPLTDDKHMQSIKTPEGRELTPEELFDFVIGNEVTDFARVKDKDKNLSDIAIVLGNGELETTRERAIKAFELYKLGIVKRIIFTGGVTGGRDIKGFMHPSSLEEYMDNSAIKQEWLDLPEADWGAETFIPSVFKKDYKEHSIELTEDFLNSIGVNPADIIAEPTSTTTQENAKFCKDFFDSEELVSGARINSAIIVTTCTHCSRATRQFKKVFGDRINFKWCPSTLDLEKYESIKSILDSKDFDEEAFRRELKKVYCTIPELTQMLRQETANHRNAFVYGDIDEPIITTIDKEKAYNDIEL